MLLFPQNDYSALKNVVEIRKNSWSVTSLIRLIRLSKTLGIIRLIDFESLWTVGHGSSQLREQFFAKS